MNSLKGFLIRLTHLRLSELGAGIVEYAIAVALIAVVSIGSLAALGDKVFNIYDCSATEIDQPGIRKIITGKIASGTALANHEQKFQDNCV